MRTIVSRRRLGFGALGATLIGSGAAAQDSPKERKRQLPWTFAPIPVVGGASGLSPIGAFHVFGGPGQVGDLPLGCLPLGAGGLWGPPLF